MPNFNRYEEDGRTLMVKFTCKRCGREHTAPLEEHDKDPESYGYLRNLKSPQGWAEIPYNILLCPQCTAEYRAFMAHKR